MGLFDRVWRILCVLGKAIWWLMPVRLKLRYMLKKLPVLEVADIARIARSEWQDMIGIPDFLLDESETYSLRDVVRILLLFLRPDRSKPSHFINVGFGSWADDGVATIGAALRYGSRASYGVFFLPTSNPSCLEVCEIFEWDAPAGFGGNVGSRVGKIVVVRAGQDKFKGWVESSTASSFCSPLSEIEEIVQRGW